MALSQAHRQAYARPGVSVQHLLAIELRHSEFPADGVLRLVNHDKDVLLQLEATAPLHPGQTVTFVGYGMDVNEPGSNVGPDSPFSIRLDGVGGYLQPFLYNANQGVEIVQATIRPIGYDVITGNVIGTDGALHLELINAKMTLTAIALSLGYANPSNRSFPSQLYTPESNPGLYS